MLTTISIVASAISMVAGIVVLIYCAIHLYSVWRVCQQPRLGDLNNRHVYNVVTALRSPDSGSPFSPPFLPDFGFALKMIFTARLRHLAGIGTDNKGVDRGMIRATPSDEDSIWQTVRSHLMQMEGKEKPIWFSHWSSHMKDALESIAILRPEVASETRFLLEVLDYIRHGLPRGSGNAADGWILPWKI